MIGGFVPYTYPSNTRSFVLVIFYAIFAALGATYLWETAREVGVRLSMVALGGAFVVVSAVVVALNIYQFFYITERTVPKTPFALVTREFQESSPDTVFYNLANVPNDANLMMVLHDHGYDTDRVIPVMNPTSPLETLREIKRDARAPYRVMIMPDMPDRQAWLDAAQTVWADEGGVQDVV